MIKLLKQEMRGARGTLLTLLPAYTSPFRPLRSNTDLRQTAATLSLQALNHTAAADTAALCQWSE